MKIKTYYLILTVIAGFFCSSVPGQVEQPQTSEEPLLISRSNPAFSGIDTLHVVVLQYDSKQDKDVLLYKQLEENVKERLHRAGIELITPKADNILTIPELRIYINTLSTKDSQQYVFNIRTALARAVCLKEQQNPVFKADIWQTIPAIQSVSEQDMPGKIADSVTEQVDVFLKIYKATNITGRKPTNTKISENAISDNLTEQIKKDGDSTANEYKYVASNSSNIFHKPDCRWAQNISKENLVTYKSKDEAIKAGKRPCKTCNP